MAEEESMVPKRVIVVGMDESSHSDYALNFYMKHVYKPEDRIVLVHCPEYHAIIQSPIPTDASALKIMMEEEEKRVKCALENMGEKLRCFHVGGKVKSVGGSPGQAVVEAAKEENASMIVTGTRGMGAIRRTILGSVSDYILHHSTVPVLVCRHKDDEHESQKKD